MTNTIIDRDIFNNCGRRVKVTLEPPGEYTFAVTNEMDSECGIKITVGNSPDPKPTDPPFGDAHSLDVGNSYVRKFKIVGRTFFEIYCNSTSRDRDAEENRCHIKLKILAH